MANRFFKSMNPDRLPHACHRARRKPRANKPHALAFTISSRQLQPPRDPRTTRSRACGLIPDHPLNGQVLWQAAQQARIDFSERPCQLRGAVLLSCLLVIALFAVLPSVRGPTIRLLFAPSQHPVALGPRLSSLTQDATFVAYATHCVVSESSRTHSLRNVRTSHPRFSRSTQEMI